MLRVLLESPVRLRLLPRHHLFRGCPMYSHHSNGPQQSVSINIEEDEIFRARSHCGLYVWNVRQTWLVMRPRIVRREPSIFYIDASVAVNLFILLLSLLPQKLIYSYTIPRALLFLCRADSFGVVEVIKICKSIIMLSARLDLIAFGRRPSSRRRVAVADNSLIMVACREEYRHGLNNIYIDPPLRRLTVDHYHTLIWIFAGISQVIVSIKKTLQKCTSWQFQLYIWRMAGRSHGAEAQQLVPLRVSIFRLRPQVVPEFLFKRTFYRFKGYSD